MKIVGEWVPPCGNFGAVAAWIFFFQIRPIFNKVFFPPGFQQSKKTSSDENIQPSVLQPLAKTDLFDLLRVRKRNKHKESTPTDLGEASVLSSVTSQRAG